LPIQRETVGADQEQLQAAVGVLAPDAVHIGARESALVQEDGDAPAGVHL